MTADEISRKRARYSNGLPATFTSTLDILDALEAHGLTKTVKKPQDVGPIKYYNLAFAEVVLALQDGTRWSTTQLFSKSEAAKVRWPNGEEQGRKCIREMLVRLMERHPEFGIRKTRDGLFIKDYGV